MEKKFSQMNKQELLDALAKEKAAKNAALKEANKANLGYKSTLVEKEQFLLKTRADQLKPERAAAHKEKANRVFGNIKERANVLKNQIKKIFDETEREVNREIAKGEKDLDPAEAQEMANNAMRAFEKTYAQIQESLAKDAGALTPAQLEEATRTTLGPLKAEAGKISSKYGIPMGNFPDLKIPEKETEPAFVDNTKWEQNTDPSYKPYRAPRVDDYPEAEKPAKKEVPVKTPYKETFEFTEENKARLEALIKRALIMDGANTDSAMFAENQSAAVLEQEIATMVREMHISNADVQRLVEEIRAGITIPKKETAKKGRSILDRFVDGQKLAGEAVANREGMVFGEKTPGAPDEAKETDPNKKSLFERFVASQRLGAEAVANREGMMFGEKPEGTPDPEKEPEAPKDGRDYFKKMFDDAESTVPGFAEMSDGQQVLVMKGIHNRMLTSIQEGAEADFQARIADQNRFGRTWSRMWEQTITAAYAKRAFMEVGGTEPEPKKGLWNKLKSKIGAFDGIWKDAASTPPEESQHLREEFLENNSGDIMNVVEQSGLDVIYYHPVMDERGAVAKDEEGKPLKGEPVVGYANVDIRTKNTDPRNKNVAVGEYLQDERSLIQFKYNEAATAFGNIPQEWGTPDAKRSQRKAYQVAREEYEESKKTYLEEVAKFQQEQKVPDAAETAKQAVSESQATVETMQYLFAHPDVYEHIENLGEHSALRLGMGTDATKERGMLMAGGALSRNLILKGAPLWNKLALFAAPVTGAAVGATRSVLRSKKEFRKMGRRARRGEKVEGEMAYGMGNVTRHIARLSGYIEKIQNVNNIEDYRQLLAELKTRVDFIDTKNELGQINVGTDLSTQYEFKRKLYEAKAMLEAGEKRNELIEKYEFGFLFDEIRQAGVEIAHEKDAEKRAALIKKFYVKNKELEGIWEENRGADNDNIDHVLDKATIKIREMNSVPPEKYKIGLVFGDIRMAAHELAKLSKGHHPDTKETAAKRAKIISDFEKAHPEFIGIWKIQPGEEVMHGDKPVNPFDAHRAEARAKELLHGMKAQNEGFENVEETRDSLKPYQKNATGDKLEYYREGPHIGLGKNEVLLPGDRTQVELRHNVGNLLNRMGGRNQEEVKSARQWKTIKDATKSAVLGAMFAEIFAPHHTPPGAPHTGPESIPDIHKNLNNLTRTPELTKLAPNTAAPEANPSLIDANEAQPPVKIHLDLRRESPDMETEVPEAVPVATSPHGVPRFQPDSLFKNAPASRDVYVSYNEGVQQPHDVYVSYRDGAPATNDVSVSYNNAEDFTVASEGGHINRVAERLLDKDFGTHHFLGIGRHASRTPEWNAIDGVPVTHALLDEGGMLVHAHKEFFDTLRQHGLENNIMPAKDETVGSYAERVYHAMARNEAAGKMTTHSAHIEQANTAAPTQPLNTPTATEAATNNAQPSAPKIIDQPTGTQGNPIENTPATVHTNTVIPSTEKPVIDVENLDINERYTGLFKANPNIETAYHDMQENLKGNTDGTAYRAIGIGEDADPAVAEKIARGDSEFNILTGSNVEHMRFTDVNTLSIKTFELPNGHHVVMVTEEIPKGNMIATDQAAVPTGTPSAAPEDIMTAPASTFDAATEIINKRGSVEVSSGEILRKMLSGTDGNTAQPPLRSILGQNGGNNTFTVVRAVGQTQEGAQLSADQLLKRAGSSISYSPRDQIYTFTQELDNGQVEVYEIRSHK